MQLASFIFASGGPAAEADGYSTLLYAVTQDLLTENLPPILSLRHRQAQISPMRSFLR